jgi:uncharacterized protein
MASEPAPIAGDDRIQLLDVTRGVAVLGILLMNITGLGLPYAYDDPTVWGGESSADFTMWRLMTLFVEGTMRGLFTLLFGASIVLFLERHATGAPQVRPAQLYFRRTLWLIAFGLFNGYVLLWSGDVLFYYGIAGLILFFFRNLAPRRLLLLAALFMILQTLISVSEWQDYREMYASAEAAGARRLAGQPMLDGDREALDAFSLVQSEFHPPRENLEAHVADVRESYATAFASLSHDTRYMQTEFFFRHGLVECLGMMLLGMGLLKLGVLSGHGSARLYLAMMLIGYALGIGVNFSELRQMEAEHFSPDALLRTFMTYDLGRIPMTLGHVGSIALLHQARWMSGASRVLAAVGRMALTNYLSQSLICLFIFTGAGLAWYGQLARHELYYVVLAIWAVQLVWSPVWLHHFRHGPAEWLWRSLTYCRWLPLRRETAAPVSAAT